jgi:hypothetical protein
MPPLPPSRAVGPDRKKNVIDRLLDVWQRYPDLRLGQLIDNVRVNLYYIEDLDLIREIEYSYRDRDVQ